MSIVVFYNRETQEAFATEDVGRFRREVFETGLRDEKDFEVASTHGFIQIKPMGKSLDVTTLDFEGETFL